MAAKEWLLPLALAAIAFVGLLALPGPHAKAADGGPIEAFPGATGPGPFVVLSRDGHSPPVSLRPASPRQETPAPALGVAGYNATSVTVHAFDSGGELVFSNGNSSEQRRLTRTYEPEQLPTGTWYLGANATAPSGTSRLPPAAAAFLDAYRGQLQGLGVGDVLTVETDALSDLYGPLWVTLRIDALVRAP